MNSGRWTARKNPPSGLRKTAKPLSKTLHPARAGKGWRKFRYINTGVWAREKLYPAFSLFFQGRTIKEGWQICIQRCNSCQSSNVLCFNNLAKQINGYQSPPKLELIKSSVKGKIKSQRIFAPNFIEQKIKHLRCNIFFHFTTFDIFNRCSEY